jgi:hypothetical protein
MAFHSARFSDHREISLIEISVGEESAELQYHTAGMSEDAYDGRIQVKRRLSAVEEN